MDITLTHHHRSRLRTFGALALERDGGNPSGGRKPLLLVAYLASRRGASASRAELATLLWESVGDDRARHSLRQALLWLRRHLGDEALRLDGETVTLRAAAIDVDVLAFEDAARRGDDDAVVAARRGGFLPDAELTVDGEAFREWLDGRRAWLDRLFAESAERLTRRHAAAGDWNAAAEAALRWTDEQPDDETAHELAVAALARADRAGEARALADAFTARWQRAFGDAPTTDLVALSRLPPAPPPAPASSIPSPLSRPDAPSDGEHPSEPGAAPAASPTSRERAPAARSRARLRAIGAIAGALALAVLAFARRAPDRAAAADAGDMVAVLPFTVRGAPEFEYLREGMVDLLSARLDGAGALRATDPHAILAAWGDRGEPEVERARTVSARLGADLFVLGSVVVTPGDVRVLASLYGPATPPIATAETSLRDESELSPAVAQLASTLLAGHAARRRRALAEPAAFNGTSLDALKAYLVAEQAFRRGRYGDALDAYRRATDADSTFALAHFRTAVAIEYLGGDPRTFAAPLDAALRGADGLPWRARALLRAVDHYHRGRAVDAETELRRVLAEDPNDVDALFTLAEVLFHAGPRAGRARALPEARALYDRVLALDAMHEEALLHRIRLAVAERDAPSARRALEALRRTPLGEAPIVLTAASLVDVAFGDSAMRITVADRLRPLPLVYTMVTAAFAAVYAGSADAAAALAQVATDPARPAGERAVAFGFAAMMHAAAGRDEQAARALTQTAALHAPHAARLAALLLLRPSSAALADDIDRARRALRTASDARYEHSGDERYFLGDASDGRLLDRYLDALLLAQRGDHAAALEAAGQVQADSGADRQLAAALAQGVRADVAMRTGDPARALAALRDIRFETWHQLAMSTPLYALARERWLMAEALTALGRREEAAAWRARPGATPSDLLFAATTSP